MCWNSGITGFTYDNEPFLLNEQMDKFAEENGLQRISRFHREII